MTSRRRRGAPYLARPTRQVEAELAARIAQGEQLLETLDRASSSLDHATSSFFYGPPWLDRSNWRESNEAYLKDAFSTDEVAEGYCLPPAIGGRRSSSGLEDLRTRIRDSLRNEINYLVKLRATLHLYEASPEDIRRAQSVANLARIDHERRLKFNLGPRLRLEKWLAGPGIVCMVAAATGQVVSYSGWQVASINSPLARILTGSLGLVLFLLSFFVVAGEPTTRVDSGIGRVP